MRSPRLFIILLALLLPLAWPTPAHADGIIVPEPPFCDPRACREPVPLAQLAIEHHRVNVSIKDQVAITHVDQVFRNDNDWEMEGTYFFPLPLDAAITSFSLWIDGEPVMGRVLTREEARRTYEEIVNKLRDPALLEYIDRGAFQASIYPIPPGGSRRIELEYSQVLTAEDGLFHYLYPLSTEKFSRLKLETVSVSVEVEAEQPLRAIYSPSHPLAIERRGERAFTAGYEEHEVLPTRDFELYFSVDPKEIGLNLLTYRQGAEDGFFLLLAAPGVEVGERQTIARDIFLVLDQSGSMDGEKFRQAQQALLYVLDHLNPADRFNVISFSTGVQVFSSRLSSTDGVAAAKRWVNALSAQGSTDINRALLETFSQTRDERQTLIIFLTDGLPSEGVTERDQILRNLLAAAPENIRLFPFGVGFDVDTFLLDQLAAQHHGAATYVSPDQALDEAISAFYARISKPVLTDLVFDFGEVEVYDTHPQPIPDLFAGGQVVLVGRYRNPQTTNILLSGLVDGRQENYRYPEQRFTGAGGPDFLPRLWATRKIGDLLSQIRLSGPNRELIDQVIALSIRYGIVTEYTSYLVTEPIVAGTTVLEDLGERVYLESLSAAPLFSGEAAVDRSAVESRLEGADYSYSPEGEAADLVRLVGARTFRLVDGVWLDTAFDPQAMETRKVAFLSEDYFKLAAVSPDLAAALSLGPRVVVLYQQAAYEVIAADQAADNFELPSSSAPGEPSSSGYRQNPAILPPLNPPGSSCPAGLLPLAALPLGLVLLRRRQS